MEFEIVVKESVLRTHYVDARDRVEALRMVQELYDDGQYDDDDAQVERVEFEDDGNEWRCIYGDDSEDAEDIIEYDGDYDGE